MRRARPHDGAAGSAQLRDGCRGALDIFLRNVAEDAAEQQQVGGRGPDAGVGAPCVRVDHFDAVRRKGPSGLDISYVELDEPTADIRTARVDWQQRQDVEPAASAQTQQPNGSLRHSVQSGRKLRAHRTQALGQRALGSSYGVCHAAQSVTAASLTETTTPTGAAWNGTCHLQGATGKLAAGATAARQHPRTLRHVRAFLSPWTALLRHGA